MVDLPDNQITGSVPDALCELKPIPEIYVDVDDNVICSCCAIEMFATEVVEIFAPAPEVGKVIRTVHKA